MHEIPRAVVLQVDTYVISQVDGVEGSLWGSVVPRSGAFLVIHEMARLVMLSNPSRGRLYETLGRDASMRTLDL